MYIEQLSLSEKQFNTTTSDLAIEEVYTNLDVEPNDPCISTKGFAFRYPQRWLNDPSQNKAIGLRKLSITPQPISLKLYFSYLSPSTKNEIGFQYLSIDVLPENNMLEVLTKIRDKLYERKDNQNTRVYLTFIFICLFYFSLGGWNVATLRNSVQARSLMPVDIIIFFALICIVNVA